MPGLEVLAGQSLEKHRRQWATPTQGRSGAADGLRLGPARAGVHRRDEEKTGRVGRRPAGTRDRDRPLPQRLAQSVQDRRRGLRELVQKQDATVREITSMFLDGMAKQMGTLLRGILAPGLPLEWDEVAPRFCRRLRSCA